ncbi:hypothetical protein FNAPI_13854 [Fusarium napiforme]|uniref:Uncharacterized protein n=1 Tax=Fusarium napiforme TaxID=42672 RepID=A0A8H5I574_9HYPO|nr:hypothetical protein FNAPI_13854 [Fusarium napiforme]
MPPMNQDLVPTNSEENPLIKASLYGAISAMTEQIRKVADDGYALGAEVGRAQAQNEAEARERDINREAEATLQRVTQDLEECIQQAVQASDERVAAATQTATTAQDTIRELNERLESVGTTRDAEAIDRAIVHARDEIQGAVATLAGIAANVGIDATKLSLLSIAGRMKTTYDALGNVVNGEQAVADGVTQNPAEAIEDATQGSDVGDQSVAESQDGGDSEDGHAVADGGGNESIPCGPSDVPNDGANGESTGNSVAPVRAVRDVNNESTGEQSVEGIRVRRPAQTAARIQGRGEAQMAVVHKRQAEDQGGRPGGSTRVRQGN